MVEEPACRLLPAAWGRQTADVPLSTTETGTRLFRVARKRPLTWAEVGFLNAGIRATSRGLKFAMGWGLATAQLGHDPESIEEYAETMQERRATGFREP